jgi:hypothetical protein
MAATQLKLRMYKETKNFILNGDQLLGKNNEANSSKVIEEIMYFYQEYYVPLQENYIQSGQPMVWGHLECNLPKEISPLVIEGLKLVTLLGVWI